MVALSKRAWLGVGREATAGTLLTTPTKFYSCKATMKGIVKGEYINEERGTMDEDYGYIPGTQYGTLEVSGFWYNDVSPYYLFGWCGGVVSVQPNATSDPTVYQHTSSLVDDPAGSTPFTLSHYINYDAAVYTMPYCAIEKFTFKYNVMKGLEFTASAQGMFPSKYTGATITPTYSTLLPFSSYAPVITLGGVQTLDVEEVTITGERKLNLWFSPNGSPNLSRIYYGPRKVTVDFTARFDTTGVYDRYTSRTLDALNLTFNGPIIAGTYNQQLAIEIPILNYDDVEMDKGKENVLIKAKGTAMPGTWNTTPTNIVGFVITNTVTSYTV